MVPWMQRLTTFAPITITSDTGLNKTINATTNNASEVKGSLKVSISGISSPENLSVILDNETVGTVTPTTPLYLMVSEGNHTVMVCKNLVCKQENVTTIFGRYVTVDFINSYNRMWNFQTQLRESLIITERKYHFRECGVYQSFDKRPPDVCSSQLQVYLYWWPDPYQNWRYFNRYIRAISKCRAKNNRSAKSLFRHRQYLKLWQTGNKRTYNKKRWLSIIRPQMIWQPHHLAWLPPLASPVPRGGRGALRYHQNR